jgi:MFS family permease
VGYALADRPATVAVIRGAMGAAFGLKYAALVVLTDRMVPTHLRNTGQALMQMASWAIGPVIGPVIGGIVYVHLGPPTLFAGAAVFAAGGALLSWWALRGVGSRAERT